MLSYYCHNRCVSLSATTEVTTFEWKANKHITRVRRYRKWYSKQWLFFKLLCTGKYHLICVIQIKICAEYRDMLPRPRLVCQEPGMRPIGRSPGVPDKSSRGLGSMSRYSAQILNLFYSIHFPNFFHSSVGLVGNFAGLPSAIVHCNQNESGHQTIKAPSMPCWGAAGPSKHSLAFKSQPCENER